MINIKDNEWIPSEGYKYISNGNTWSEHIFLGKKDNINNWHDTNDEPPEPEDDEDATEQDYIDALNEMGVDV